MKEVTVTRTVYETGDVIRLKGKYVPTEEQRKGVKETNVMILKTNVFKSGIVNCTGITRDFNKVTIKEDQMDNAGYLGKVDLYLFIKDEIVRIFPEE